MDKKGSEARSLILFGIKGQTIDFFLLASCLLVDHQQNVSNFNFKYQNIQRTRTFLTVAMHLIGSAFSTLDSAKFSLLSEVTLTSNMIATTLNRNIKEILLHLLLSISLHGARWPAYGEMLLLLGDSSLI